MSEPPAACAECGKASTNDSMWALYCLDCCMRHIVPMEAQPLRDRIVELETLLRELQNARPLLLYGEEWIWRIVAALNRDATAALAAAVPTVGFPSR